MTLLLLKHAKILRLNNVQRPHYNIIRNSGTVENQLIPVNCFLTPSNYCGKGTLTHVRGGKLGEVNLARTTLEFF